MLTQTEAALQKDTAIGVEGKTEFHRQNCKNPPPHIITHEMTNLVSNRCHEGGVAL